MRHLPFSGRENRPPLGVDRRKASELSLEEFRSTYVMGQRPVVITEGIRDWRALALWSFDYLDRKVGHRTVSVSYAESSVFGGGYAARSYQAMTFREYLTKMPARHYYLQETYLPQVLPEIEDDVGVPSYVDEPRLVRAKQKAAWFGSAGVIKALHYDLTDNILCQIRGRKRFKFFSSDQYARMYPLSDTAFFYNSQILDSDHPDLSQYPLFRDAISIECVLEAAEMLYVPPYWWHNVYALEDNISVNYWWERGLWQRLKLFYLTSPRPWYEKLRRNAP